MLVEWITCVSIPRARSQRASQNPSRPASYAMRILVPVDGSDSSLAAVRFVIAKLASAGTPQEIHLLTVQPQLPTASRFDDAGMLRDYRHEEGAKDIAAARKLPDNAAVEYTSHITAGDPADTNATYHHHNQSN